ncbi:inhibitory synaptic factor 2A-like isoform X2 [Denticeps clupeoides]|uniref:inhibitory synaptic factor 2A-like isoform X2 n=1 Tax=Denticeps clupeoides TaxID=299321 RepID=UPI0010A54E8B|nr:inhibitory synaptic factor 2A-like isoform X2 [Denticeps clupeoides]
MVTREHRSCYALSDSGSDSEVPPSLACESPVSHDSRRRSRALQVRFRDTGDWQGRKAPVRTQRWASCKVQSCRRRSSHLTRSAAVQTSPDLAQRYCTFPPQRHTHRDSRSLQDGGFQNNNRTEGEDEERGKEGKSVQGTHSECRGDNEKCLNANSTDESWETHPDTHTHSQPQKASRTNVYPDTHLHTHTRPDTHSDLHPEPQSHTSIYFEHVSVCERISNTHTCTHTHPRSAPKDPKGPTRWQEERGGSKSRGMSNQEELQMKGERSDVPWPNVTHIHHRRGSLQFNSMQTHTHIRSQTHTLPRAQRQTGPHVPFAGNSARQAGEPAGLEEDRIRLQHMEAMMSCSLETIRVLLGVIQELERTQAIREGLLYRTGQDTANCDTCRNSACIIYRAGF